MTLSISDCLDHINECAESAKKMRTIVENPAYPTELRYRAIVIEEGHLELIERYIRQIERIKNKSYEQQTSPIHRNNPKD